MPESALGRLPDRTFGPSRSYAGFPEGLLEEWDLDGAEEVDGSRTRMIFQIQHDLVGSVDQTAYRSGGSSHRIGGPAVTYYRPDGTVISEDYFAHGAGSRIDGPASLSYRTDGTIEQTYYFYENDLFASPRPYADAVIRHETPGDLAAALRAGPLAHLLVAGHRPAAILDVVGSGLLTPEGIAAVLDGAPVEWARAFESGLGHTLPGLS